LPARWPSTDTYSDTYAMHGQMWAYPKATSDSARSPDSAMTFCGGFASRRVRQRSPFAEKFPGTVTGLDV
jgi:hypothetical protein